MKTKAYAKVNIYLKITGTRGNFHIINSRFMRVDNLYDTISFVEKEKAQDSFEIEGKFSCKKEQNIIYKAYKELTLIKNISKKVENFFKHYKVSVEKSIPEFAGLGGGSSNAAAFLNLTNKTLSLKLDKKELILISQKLGADVAFFINEYESANVSGVGEIVEKFPENVIKISTLTPPIKCETPLVYKRYREILNQNYDKIIKNNRLLADKLQYMKSDEILQNYDIFELNDLYQAALDIYPKLKEYQKDNNFFSGSGSTFFKTRIL